MSFLKEFHYSNIISRRIVLANTLLTCMFTGFFITDISLYLKYYNYYSSVIKIILITVLISYSLGNVTGRFLFTRIKNSRILYVAGDSLFIILSILYIMRNFIFSSNRELLLDLFNYSPLLIFLIIFVLLFTVGIKTNYFLKISCGNFLDEQPLIYKFILFSIIGVTAGFILKGGSLFIEYLELSSIAIPVLTIPLVFLINLSYNPKPLYAREFEGDDNASSGETSDNAGRDNLLFIFINFSVIAIYCYLSYTAVLKLYGNQVYYKFLFLIILCATLTAGIIAGNLIKQLSWYKYLQALYPPLYLIFILIPESIFMKMPVTCVFALFSPLGIVFGMSISQTIRNLFNIYTQGKRFNIADISFNFIPVPIIIAMSFVPFTNFWFFTLGYMLCLINIIIPGLDIINRKGKVYKKILYFSYILIFIPFIIFINMFFSVPMDSAFYNMKITNYDKLKYINYNAPYIKGNISVKLDQRIVFNASDSIIRNLKRSLAPVAMYYSNQDNKQVLFIDGNQRFFRNPCIGYFRKALCLDPLTERIVDYDTLPFSGKQNYVPDSEELLLYLNKRAGSYSIIVDIPNILDQKANPFRFTTDYYALIKKHLDRQGIFCQILNIPGCTAETISTAVRSLQKTYSSHAVYLFSDVLLVMCSDSANTLAIKKINYDQLNEFMVSQNEEQALFFDEQQALSHLLTTSMDEFTALVPDRPFTKTYFISNNTEDYVPSMGIMNNYMKEDDRFMRVIEKSSDDYYFISNARARFDYNKNILSLLKKTEYAEATGNYEEETSSIFELKKQMDYRIALKEYMLQVLSYKEKSYYNAALKFEEEKKWDNAIILYKAILGINKDNFDANYRFGILSITLQNIENATYYLQNAMKLKGDDPKVLYQMGVLEFTKGNMSDAVNYFNSALKLKETGSSLYLYLGMSYEELGNLAEAEYFYSKAQVEDPNDVNIQSRLNNLLVKKEEEKKKWQEVQPKNQTEEEKDVDIPIPVNKSAYDIRLKDNEENKE